MFVQPNLVIVMTDQQRADLRRGCGYPLDTMPYLDRFAAGGMDFRCAYTPNPCCVPARISMFTGRYPSCHNARTNHNIRDVLCGDDLIDVLRHAGYQTALCGKNDTHRTPKDFDFCERTGHLGGGGEINETPEQIEFAAFLQATKHMEMHAPSPGGVEVQHPYRNVTSAFKFLDTERRADTPFFMWLSFAEPHNPYQVPEPYFDMFPPETLPPLATNADDCAKKGEDFVWERRAWEKVLGADIENRIQRMRSNYHGMLRLIDDQFRRFMEGLEARGLRENTVVVFLSDHGDYVGEYGLLRKGVGLPEVLTRVTMAWQGPGIVQKTDTSSFVNLVDILPTVCDFIGEEIPFGSQGRSLVPLLCGESVSRGEFDVGYSEYGYGGLYWNEDDHLTTAADRCLTDGKTFACMSSWTQAGQTRMARKGDWKIQMDMLGNGFLYNLKEDPYELHNLFDDEAYTAVKAEMLASLTAAVLRASDPIPAPRNRYRTKLHPKGYWFDDSYIADDPGVPDGSIADFVKRRSKGV